MYSRGPLHTDEQGTGDELESIYNRCVLTEDVVWKKFQSTYIYESF